MTHHHHGRSIKSIHQQPALLVHREIKRPSHGAKSTYLVPLESGIEQRIGNLLIFNTLKKAKETNILVMLLIMLSVGMCRYPADNFFIPLCQIQLYLGMLIIWILKGVKELLLFADKRCHPIGIILIKLKRQHNKLVQPFGAIYRYYFNHLATS